MLSFNTIISLIVIGFLLWLVNTYLPMDRKIKKILNFVVVLFTIIWLLKLFGIISI
ncbi:Thivi_2564 family membrane protein [Lacihabitans lacunae]|uniref:Thivi_2564 family membrane protein n=1 Tax=Lacihabitans lacunae TaxID=1028214 RepID=A0ABV7Z4F2_9BACT